MMCWVMGKQRPISKVIDAITTTEGEGFIVHRSFPNNLLRDFDPFLLLDEMGPIELPPGQAKGAPDHPHRGFETVTYVIEGAFEHKDSQGNKGKLYSGDVQWMTAGSGVIHSEMPESEFTKNGGKLHGFQLWVNLPKIDKMMKPRYQDISSKNIPVNFSEDGKVKVKVIAGESMGKTAIIDTKIPITYLHFSMQPGSTVIQKIPDEYNSFAYVIDGEGYFGEEKKLAHKEQAIFFEKCGDEITIHASENSKLPLEVLLFGGSPIGEPISRYGPFVMNTDEEIQKALADYRSGKMGQINF